MDHVAQMASQKLRAGRGCQCRVRFKPQKGIHHFLVGGAAKLRKGDTRRGPLTAAAFDRDRSFVIVEIIDNRMFFQAISRTGAVVDEGILTTRETAEVTRASVLPLVRSP